MTDEDVKRLQTIMVASYPNYKPENIKLTINVWHEMLRDYSYEEAVLALKTFIATDTSGFAPSVGQLIGMITKLNSVENMNPNEAWSLVREAISNGGYHSKEEFDKLPPLVQKAVGSPNQIYAWAMDEHFNESVVSSHFISVYKVICDRSDMEKRMPKEARLKLESIRAKALGQKERVLIE